MLIRVLLVDDHAVVREGYRRLLEQDPSIRIVSEAADAATAYLNFRDVKPDVVVMDIALPDVSGLEALRRMLALQADARILMFSMFEDAIYAQKALSAGALGYLTKASAPEVLVSAVHQVAAGKTFVSEDAARNLAQYAANDCGAALQSLSVREFEILQLLVRGHTLNEIAERLYLTQKTVANIQSSVKQKLNAENSAQLVLIALKMGILVSGELPLP
jgi:two-component system invasion response regulator UvrY